jgi:putative PIN family toxin of toxin-antitoxin system
MRVVIDTNVFVSSFFGGKPKKIINLWKSGEITLCLSAPVIDEYIDVLKRMAGIGNIDELLLLFKNGYNCIFCQHIPSIKISADPDDDKFIETAVALKAEFVVSGDQHLKDIGKYSGIVIIPPKDFLELISKG